MNWFLFYAGGFKVPKPCGTRTSRGSRSILGGFVRRHESVCDSRQKGYDHAQGHSVGQTHPWGTCLNHLDDDYVNLYFKLFLVLCSFCSLWGEIESCI